MPYQTGPATSPQNLLSQFLTFVVAAGWTLDDDVADGTGHKAHIHKGAKYVSLRSFINENSPLLGGLAGSSGIALTGATAYAVTANWFNQAGAPFKDGFSPTADVITCIMPLPAGAISNYWMFADVAGDNVVLVALKGGSVYTHLFFGDLTKYGTWTGGPYFGASRSYFGLSFFGLNDGLTVTSAPPGAAVYNQPSALLLADVDSHTGKWLTMTGQTVAPDASTGKRMQSSTSAIDTNMEIAGDHIHYGFLRRRAESANTSGLILLPTIWLAERDFGGNRFGGGWAALGEVPWLYQSTTDGFSPGSTQMISTDAYSVFPGFAVRQFT